MDAKAAAAEVLKMVEARKAFHYSMLKVCAKTGISYEKVRAEYFIAKGYPNEPFMPEVYNAAGVRSL